MCALLTLALTVTPVGDGTASAAIWVSFDPTAAKPGMSVAARTADESSLAQIADGRLELYLAPHDVADGISSPDDPRLTAIGELRADREAVGGLRFIVPDLPSGLYETVASCRSCRNVFTVGPFRISAGTFRVPPRSAQPPSVGAASLPYGVVGAVGGVLLCVAVLLVVRRRRSAS